MKKGAKGEECDEDTSSGTGRCIVVERELHY